MRKQRADSATDAPDAARHVRMLTTLMAGCDPCGWVDAGRSPNQYAGVALDMLSALHHGADVPRLLMRFPGDASVEKATRFARVALDWWQTAQDARGAAGFPRHHSA